MEAFSVVWSGGWRLTVDGLKFADVVSWRKRKLPESEGGIHAMVRRWGEVLPTWMYLSNPIGRYIHLGRYIHPFWGHSRGLSSYRRWALTALSEGIEAREPVASVRSPAMARVEAILFLSKEPLGSRKIAQYAGLADGTEARTLVRKLNRVYDEGGYAFRVVEVGGGFQLRARAKFAPWLRRMEEAPSELRLSAPALETLAVVAYRQPILRSEIEAIRGVQCGEILRQLMERDLIRIVGRSEELGRPFLYGTSRRFLQIFGLRHLDDLPRLTDDLSVAAGLASDDPDVPKNHTEQPSIQPIHSTKMEGESNVKTAVDPERVSQESFESSRLALVDAPPSIVLDAREDDDEDWDEDEDLDEEDEDDYEDYEEDEDEEELDEDLDEDEDEDWEEVEDEDLDEDELDEDEDEDDWDEDDEDWDEDEDDWDEDEDDWE